MRSVAPMCEPERKSLALAAPQNPNPDPGQGAELTGVIRVGEQRTCEEARWTDSIRGPDVRT